MKLEPYSYVLPRERIAQRPAQPPESARLLVADRGTGEISHTSFARIGDFLRRGDRLVFNETKVIPARLFGQGGSDGAAEIEVLLVEQQGPARWLCMGRPLWRVRAGATVTFGTALEARVIPSDHVDRVILEFSSRVPGRHVVGLIQEAGTMPIPPYIRAGHGDEQDVADYQSIFARQDGSIAAPTASLHFTESLMSLLQREPGADVSTVVLHVGTASYQPVVVNGQLRAPASERFCVSSDTLAEVGATRASGGRVVAVGTTVTRALETAVRLPLGAPQGATELFISPGFEFRAVDALVTNFHQPGTTHLLLVEALLGRDLLGRCYEEALREGYRFLSYGDGMLIV